MELSNYLWAKKKVDDLSYKWLPLNQHLEDTRNIGGLLRENWLSDGQKERISQDLGYFDMEDSKKVFMFLCQVHDLGKATYNFQTTKTWSSTEELETILKDKLYKIGFEDLEKKLGSANKTHHSLAGQMILIWNGFGEDLSSIIGSHHGNTPDDQKVTEQKGYLSNYYMTENTSDPDYLLWKKVQEEIINKALADNNFESIEDLPNISKHSQIILSGLLIMADWIASNENYFPLIDIENMEVKNPKDRHIEAYKKWEKSDLWKASGIIDIENKNKKSIYNLRFGFSPRDAQEKFKNVIVDTEDPGIFIFEAPMGIGKTEAALVGVEELSYKTNRSGMFFGLPTQATSNAIFPRIEDWLEKIETDKENKHGIRLAHGKASLNSDYTSLASGVNVDQSEEFLNQSVVINEWFAGRKKTSLDDFVIGTVDQFLLMSLKQKHVALRHLGFDKKVVVIDEVHAYDTYMDQYLEESLRWLGSYGVPVILLSATLPSEKREDMLEAYLRGRGESSTEIKKKLTKLDKNSYPLISYTDGVEVKQYKDFIPGDKKEVEVIKYYSEDYLPLIKDLWENDGIIGIVVNTVKKAQVLAKTCSENFGEDSVELLHSSFIASQRAEKEKNLLDLIGKKGKRPKKKIIIGTQVIEQSLDIDFDVLITDLAPMDLMIQRIGRLHRHKRSDRPKAYKNPKVYIGGLNEEFDFEDGSVAVYGSYLLARSQYYLPEKLLIPDDISKLVQKVYSNDVLDLEDSLMKKYKKFLDDENLYKEKKKRKAKVFLLNEFKTKRQTTMVNWLEGNAVLQTEEKANAQVRDSKDTLEVIALKKVGDGYGLFGKDVDISKNLESSKLCRKIANNTIKLPTALTVSYNIDKTIDILEAYNIKNLRQFQKEAWLKGSLGIIFDENNEFILNNYKLTYSEKYGLSYEKIGKE